VILINLLPHREERRQLRRRNFFIGLAAAALVGALLAGLWYSVLAQMTKAQDDRNNFLKEETTKLDLKIKDIANLRTEIDALNARKKAVEDLQTDRNVPVHLLDELVRHTPEGVFLQSIKQVGSLVTIMGTAQTNERVSELLRNTSYNSRWLEKPELVEIKAASAMGPNKEPRRVFDFSMKVSIKRPNAVAPASAASAVGTGAAVNAAQTPAASPTTGPKATTAQPAAPSASSPAKAT
jgi:type IV pilus assembly protein PilN